MLSTQSLSDPNYVSFRYWLMVQTEGVTSVAYLDTANIPSIGIGFNLTNSTVFNAVMDDFGVGASETGVRAQLQSALGQSYASDAALQSALDAIMAQRAQSMPGAQDNFRFQTTADIQEVFATLAPSYETTVDVHVSSLGESLERAAIFSLAYNNPSLLGPSLTAALNAGDHGESWFEIRYDSNGGAGNLPSPRRTVKLMGRSHEELSLSVRGWFDFMWLVRVRLRHGATVQA
jgi:GH24 family phage-related lysozyme (muramidase)